MVISIIITIIDINHDITIIIVIMRDPRDGFAAGRARNKPEAIATYKHIHIHIHIYIYI